MNNAKEAPYMDCRNLTEVEVDAMLRDMPPRPVEKDIDILSYMAGVVVGILVGLAIGLAAMGGV